MVTDTYAHGFDSDRKLIAQEMDSGFFAKVGTMGTSLKSPGTETIAILKRLVQHHPELLAELLNGTFEEGKVTTNST